MLFDFVRAAFASPSTACTDLSRRLRDGVFLEKEVDFSGTATAVTSLHQSCKVCGTGIRIYLLRISDSSSRFGSSEERIRTSTISPCPNSRDANSHGRFAICNIPPAKWQRGWSWHLI